MKINTLRISALLMLAPVLLVSTGCVAVVAAGAAGGTVAWVRGALEVTVDKPIDKVGSASTDAVRGMKFALVSSNVDAVTGEIIARTSQDTKVEIKLKKVTDGSTEISIRVGIFGDQAVSQQIYEEIKKRL